MSWDRKVTSEHIGNSFIHLGVGNFAPSNKIIKAIFGTVHRCFWTPFRHPFINDSSMMYPAFKEHYPPVDASLEYIRCFKLVWPPTKLPLLWCSDPSSHQLPMFTRPSFHRLIGNITSDLRKICLLRPNFPGRATPIHRPPWLHDIM